MMSMRRSGQLREMMTMSGAPMHTPMAYADIRCPAWAMDTSNVDASSGSMLIITYSAMPSPNVPNASDRRPFFMKHCFCGCKVMTKWA